MSTVIYVRQSLDRSGEGAAVERQLAECHALAERQGLAVAHEYVDNDVSASKGIRPAWTELLAAVGRGEIDTVICWHTDRLYRRVRDLVELVETAERHALRILTVRAGDLDLGTPAGRMLAGMLGHAARYEVEQKAARQVASNRQRAERGEYGFSRRPFGYRRENGEVVIVEDEAAVIREIGARYLAGESYYAIAKDLNEREVATVEGRPWSIVTVRDHLKNPAYAGQRHYLGEHVAEGVWPAILDADTWAAVERMRTNRKRPHHWSNVTKYLLSGLAVCGVCGNPMLSRPDRSKRKDGSFVTRVTYSCRTGWCTQRAIEPVDDLVERVLVARLSSPDAADLLVPREDLAPLEAEIADLRQRSDDLAALVADGTLRPAAVRERQAILKPRIEALEARIEALRGHSGLGALIGASDVAERWRALPLPEQRALLSMLMTVTIQPSKTRIFKPEAIEIEWKTAA